MVRGPEARALVGREEELRLIGELMSRARVGVSGAVVLRGEAGIGKTALLEAAVRAADGMTLLRARGVESEMELPFAGLHELLRPVLGHLDAVPRPQADALRAALALDAGRPSGRFAVGAATLSLLAAAGERSPVLVVVDDLQWVDGASRSALAFAARRLVADPVAILLAARPNASGTWEDGLAELTLVGLAPAAARELLVSASAEPVPREVAESVVSSTAGNPLALVEIAAAGVAFDVTERPLPVGERVRRAFAGRLSSLPAEARDLLALAAASDTGDLSSIGAAARDLHLPMAGLEAAEAAGLVALQDGRLEFRHPLLRSVAYDGATPGRRRAAHAALAEHESERARRAWHRAFASTDPDESVASTLAAVAVEARARSGYAAAASGMERAARLTPDPVVRARRLLAAADDAWLAGAGPRALALLDDARGVEGEPRAAAAIARLRGRILARSGPVVEAHDVLVAGAAGILATDPGTAAEMLAEAALARAYAAEPELTLATARRAAEVAPRDEVRARCLALISLGVALVFAGEGGEGAACLREAMALLAAVPEMVGDPRIGSWTGLAQLFLRERGAGFEMLADAVAAARATGALGPLAQGLFYLGVDAATTERWRDARVLYSEAAALGRETGSRLDLTSAVGGLARLAAWRGDEDECRRAASEALALGAEVGTRWYAAWGLWALGDLALALGRNAEAVERYRELLDYLAETGVRDPDLSPVPDLVEALARDGRPEDARQVLAEFDRLARIKRQPWALARAERAGGLVAAAEAFEPFFARSLEQAARTTDHFEVARTRLALGERLRRRGERARARVELREAIAAFDVLGAGPWAERARRELGATGETARRRDVVTLDHLTAQELQIATLLADGTTVRQAASALYLSPKTIEYHLRNAYRKLGVNSRAAMAEILVRVGTDQTSSAISPAARAAPSGATGR